MKVFVKGKYRVVSALYRNSYDVVFGTFRMDGGFHFFAQKDDIFITLYNACVLSNIHPSPNLPSSSYFNLLLKTC